MWINFTSVAVASEEQGTPKQPEGQRGVDAGEEMMVCLLLKSSQIYQRCSDFSCLCFLVLWIDSFCSSPAPLLPSLSPVLFLCLVSSLSLCIVHLGMHPSSRLSLLGLVINADCLSPIEQQSCRQYGIYINCHQDYLLRQSALLLCLSIKSSCRHTHRLPVEPACCITATAAQRIPERNELRTPKIKALK